MDILNVLKKIDIPDRFGIEDGTDELSPNAKWYEDEIYYYAHKQNFHVYTTWGCSQFVIISDHDVYKVPFDGVFYPEDEYDDGERIEECFEYYSVNHCDKTVEIYENAIIDGVDAIFAKTEVVGYSRYQKPIYKQEYAKVYLDDNEKIEASEDSKTKAKKMYEEKYIPFDGDWLALAIDYYGKEYIERVLQFIENNDIDDLHRHNYGYAEDGRPIMFDYCSYYPV